MNLLVNLSTSFIKIKPNPSELDQTQTTMNATVQRSKFIQIFVYGKLSISNNELEDQLLEKSHEKKEPAASTDGAKMGLNYFLVLFYCFAGLQLSYLTWGVVQEKIMTTSYVKTNLSSQLVKTGRLLNSQRIQI